MKCSTLNTSSISFFILKKHTSVKRNLSFSDGHAEAHVKERRDTGKNDVPYKPKQTQLQLNNSSVFTSFKLVHRRRKN